MNASEQPRVAGLFGGSFSGWAAALLVIALSLLTNVARLVTAAEPVVLTIADENHKTHSLGLEAIAKLPRQQVTVKDRDGSEHVYEGPILADVLKSVGVALGSELRGPRLALYVTISAADDYRVVFSLAELDPTNTEGIFLFADRRDGEPLGANEGPYRIVIPREKRRGRWVRQVKRLDVLKPPSDGQKP